VSMRLDVNVNFACSLMNEVVQTSPTIGSNVEEIIWKNVRFIMWDIGGQESLRNTWNSYFTNTKVCSLFSQDSVTVCLYVSSNVKF